MSAALTPRVRTLVVCEHATERKGEPGVFDLTGVREKLSTDKLPASFNLSVFMLLSRPCPGQFPGEVLVIRQGDDKAVWSSKFSVCFDQDHATIPVAIDLDRCKFTAPGNFLLQVWFPHPDGGSACLKGECHFSILDTGSTRPPDQASPPSKTVPGIPSTELTPEILEWARQQHSEEEIVAALREFQTKGGRELKDFIQDLEAIVANDG
jgi:hypothetical protein